jgi:hypothetical protein
MSGLVGNVESLKRFSAKLRELPRVLAEKVAQAAAPALTEAAQATFNAGQDAFGVPWAPGKDGQQVTLRESGALASGIRYVAVGTKIRVVLGVSYAKYQVGRRPIFPRQGDPLPPAYLAALRAATEEVLRRELNP